MGGQEPVEQVIETWAKMQNRCIPSGLNSRSASFQRSTMTSTPEKGLDSCFNWRELSTDSPDTKSEEEGAPVWLSPWAFKSWEKAWA